MHASHPAALDLAGSDGSNPEALGQRLDAAYALLEAFLAEHPLRDRPAALLAAMEAAGAIARAQLLVRSLPLLLEGGCNPNR